MNKFLNRKDMLLMTCLRHNARENLTKISRMTHIPVSTIFDKLKEFESSLISKHTTLVDFKKLGFDIKLNMLFKIARDSREEFKQSMIKSPNVNSLYRINNGYDFLLEGVFKDMNDLQRFAEDIEKFNIEARQELFVLEDIKREGFLADSVQAELMFPQ